ncbi:MAG TPA: hypothetical protein VK928_08835 [Longimicrobiales bacterium]|nr:hypothetical protein [Longimicrobiales bacterium]
MRPTARHFRVAAWSALLLTWPVMLWFAWDAFTTVPSAERLEQSRMAPIPSLRGVLLLLGRSALELCAVLALAVPRERAWVRRMLAAAAALLLYFILTTPLSVSTVSWVHRRWLAALIVMSLAAAALALAGRLVQRLRTR